MSASRLAKSVVRTVKVAWRDNPTQHDIEALQANIQRVGLVIKLRWALVAVLTLFSLVAAAVYAMEVPLPELAEKMVVPAVALILVLGYNGLYQISYRRLGNVAFLNHAQLLFDIVVVTVLVHYSGGVYSWFVALYTLFILEAAFILPDPLHVRLIALAAALSYAGVLFAEYLGWLGHVDMPFIDNALFASRTYVLVRYLWNATMMAGAALVGTLMMSSLRQRERQLKERSVHDETTGLYDRTYFRRALESEVERARSNNLAVGLVLLDVYNFSEFNRLFGVEQGDRMLRAIAGVMRTAAAEDARGAGEQVDIVCRLGGEELGVILPEFATAEGAVSGPETRTVALAERLRREVAALRIEGATVSASVGVAVFPAQEIDSAEGLLDAADRALARAAAAGGNAVRVAGVPDDDEIE